MKKLFVFILTTLSCVAFAKERNDVGVLPYEIFGAGTATQGSCMVDVIVTSAKSNINDQEIVKSAIHGVLFKGFFNEELRLSQKPLTGSALVEQQHADFFKDFFNSSYQNYGQALQSSRRVTKISRKEYKIQMTIIVSKNQLRKDLEEAGIIKKLNSGF